MTDLQKKIDAVRGAWRRTEMLKGIAALISDTIVIVLALIAIDAIYHLAAPIRGGLLLVGLGILAGAAFLALLRPLKKKHADGDLALYVENRFPDLKGTLIAAVEFEGREANSATQAGLIEALVTDCLERASRVNIADAIDRGRLRTRVIAAAVLLAFFLGAVLIKPQLFQHQLARVLTPWVEVPLSDSEKELIKQREEQKALADQVMHEIEERAKPVKIELNVMPGNTEVARGGELAIDAGANKITGVPVLKFKGSDGEWRKLEMNEDPSRPEHYTRTLSDLSEDVIYRVAMKDIESPEFTIHVFDPATIKNLRLTYHFPKFMEKPDHIVTGMDGNIEALEGSTVDVALIATGPLKSGKLALSSGEILTMTATGVEVSGTITVDKPGDYSIVATDVRGTVLSPPTRFSITPTKPLPPTLEIVYPTIDSLVHPMEEVAFAAKVESTLGLKEVRLHTFYNSEAESIQRVSCRENGEPAAMKLAEFVIELEKRKGVQAGDTILYHFEAEDMKGQISSSDVYTVTVRALESFSAYGYHPVMPAHGYAGPALINVIGAAWDLHNKEKTMTPEEFKAACEKVARALEDNH